MKRLKIAQAKLNELTINLIALNSKLADVINNEEDISLLELKSFTECMGQIGESSAKAFEDTFNNLGSYTMYKSKKRIDEGRYE